MDERTWNGFYMDGRTAGKKAVTVRIAEEGLKIRKPDGELTWPYHELRQVQGFYENEPVHLEYGGALPEVLVIDDPAFLSSLHRALSQPVKHFHNPVSRRHRVRMTCLAAVAILAIAGAVYLWVIPLAISLVASHVPLKWEEGLGRSALKVLAPEDARCKDPELANAMERIVERLTSGQPEAAPFRIFIVNQDEFNALALPGGNIIVFRGLLEKSGSAEALAGIIAHELQHIRLRHVTKRILSDFSRGFLISAFSGGGAAYGARIAHQLAALRYSRADENEADAEGMKLQIAAGLDPEAMIRFFETFRGKFDAPGVLKYVSTHPEADERLARLRRLASKSPATGPFLPILKAGTDWQSLRMRCGGTLKQETGNPSE